MSTPPLLPPQTSSNFIKQSRKKGMHDLVPQIRNKWPCNFVQERFGWFRLIMVCVTYFTPSSLFCDFGLNNLNVICRGVIVFLGHYFLSAWMLRLPMKMFFLGSLIDQHFNGFFSIGGEAFQSGYVKALVLLKASSLSLSPCSVSDGLGVVSFIGLKSQISDFVPPPHLHSGKWGSFFKRSLSLWRFRMKKFKREG